MRTSHCWFLLALLALWSVPARSDDAPSLDTILKAWQAREQSTKSFDFRWRSKRFDNGSFQSALLRRQAARNHEGDPVYAPETTYIAKYRFLLDDKDRLRLEHEDVEWSLDKKDYLPRTTVDIFDGSNNKTLFKGGVSEFNVAFIGINQANIGKFLWLLPIRLTFRSLTGASSVFDKDKLTLADNSNSSDVDGFIVLHDDHLREVWVDPTKDYVPVKLFEHRQDGSVIDRMTISHRHDPVDGWIPQAWTMEVFQKNGQLETSDATTVIEHSINKSASDSDFDLDMSGGAYVRDSKNGQYILRPDGTKRPILKGEFNGHNFEELMNSEPAST